MSYEWIKMRTNLRSQREVKIITAKLGLADADLVVGKLHRFWSWCDGQTVDGTMDGITMAMVDEEVGCPGFAKAMVEVGWLTACDDYLGIPKYTRHNGETAKKRAMAYERKIKQRSGEQWERDKADHYESEPNYGPDC